MSAALPRTDFDLQVSEAALPLFRTLVRVAIREVGPSQQPEWTRLGRTLDLLPAGGGVIRAGAAQVSLMRDTALAVPDDQMQAVLACLPPEASIQAALTREAIRGHVLFRLLRRLRGRG